MKCWIPATDCSVLLLVDGYTYLNCVCTSLITRADVGLENHMIGNYVISKCFSLEPSLPTFRSCIWGKHLGTLASAAKGILRIVSEQVLFGTCLGNQIFLFAESHKPLNFVVGIVTFVDAFVMNRCRRWLEDAATALSDGSASQLEPMYGT